MAERFSVYDLPTEQRRLLQTTNIERIADASKQLLAQVKGKNKLSLNVGLLINNLLPSEDGRYSLQVLVPDNATRITLGVLDTASIASNPVISQRELEFNADRASLRIVPSADTLAGFEGNGLATGLGLVTFHWIAFGLQRFNLLDAPRIYIHTEATSNANRKNDPLLQRHGWTASLAQQLGFVNGEEAITILTSYGHDPKDLDYRDWVYVIRDLRRGIDLIPQLLRDLDQ